MAETVLHRGYCVKSPPIETHRWHNRFCTLSLMIIPDIVDFHKKYNKDCKNDSNKRITSTSKHYVFSYYKNDADEVKGKAIKKFIIDSSTTIEDDPNGIGDYKHVIKLQFGPVYNNRKLLMCFSDKREHQPWLDEFDKNLRRSDTIEKEVTSPVQKFESMSDTPLQAEIKRFRTIINKEREEKARSKMSEESSDEEYQAHNEEGLTYQEYQQYKEIPNDDELTML